MTRVTILTRTILLCGGIGWAAAAAEPAAAQVDCPLGYFYSSNRGCLPVGEGSVLANQPLLRRENRLPVALPAPHPAPAPAHIYTGFTGGSFGHSFGGGFGRR